MDRVFIFLACLAAFLVLCQWFVFAWVRKYLFQRYHPVSRKVAYSVLALIAVLNFAAVRFSVESAGGIDLSLTRKIVSVAYFSYLGSVLSLSVFFLVVGIAWSILRLTDVLLERIKPLVGKPRAFSADERGFLKGAPRGMLQACRMPDSELTEACRSTADISQSSTERAVQAEPVQSEPRIQGPTRRNFLKWGTAAAVAIAVGETGRGIAEAYQRPVVEEFDLLLPGLDGVTQPLTIIQVTDFHYGLFLGNAELQRLVNLLNRLEGDMVVITGDIFHSPISPIGEAPDILRTLRDRRLGNLAIMGNHDFYAGELRSVDAIRAGRLNLLRNQWLTLSDQGPRIYLGGIDDPMVNWVWGARFPRFEHFMGKAPKGPGVRILLSHRPNILPLAAAAGLDFVMAGHIHGGQIVIPWPGVKGGVSLASLVSDFTHGWYRDGKTRMYLNRGVGLTFVPWRVNCPPEIAVVHLKPGTGLDPSVQEKNSDRKEIGRGKS